MSRTSELKSRIHSLHEIESILGAMKSLAIIELNKVNRCIANIEKTFETISLGQADFEFYFPAGSSAKEGVLCLLIGSERGFCGPFNERVIDAFLRSKAKPTGIKVATVGRKLATKLEGKIHVDLALCGPSSVDEIPAVISEIAKHLLPFARHRWMFIHNDHGNMVSFPLEQHSQSSDEFFSPPLLNMEPSDLYPLLLEQHLFSVINRALYVSFLAENRERLQHMEGALGHIQKESSQLELKLMGLRQEDVTEELEILMMNASGGR